MTKWFEKTLSEIPLSFILVSLPPFWCSEVKWKIITSLEMYWKMCLLSKAECHWEIAERMTKSFLNIIYQVRTKGVSHDLESWPGVDERKDNSEAKQRWCASSHCLGKNWLLNFHYFWELICFKLLSYNCKERAFILQRLAIALLWSTLPILESRL